MKCQICDRNDDSIHYDKSRGQYTDCLVCQAIIQETLAGYGDDEPENHIEVDHPERRQDDRPHGESVEPAREGKRSG